ncbi:HPr family phosphocarrier protein [Dendrosporobacter sp. 1207_IL3150]|uniref:HPr family phosphocarrier protein n=1 Tax=Dendrosporobacter sp. 1207_IL3150 TaxID=3084054 RepID=UPI002FD998F4
MYSAKVLINNKTGLHARPATLFTQAASKFQSRVTIQKDEKAVDAKSILKVLALGIGQGTEITISADGSDEREAVEALSKLLESNFGE